MYVFADIDVVGSRAEDSDVHGARFDSHAAVHLHQRRHRRKEIGARRDGVDIRLVDAVVDRVRDAGGYVAFVRRPHNVRADGLDL